MIDVDLGRNHDCRLYGQSCHGDGRTWSGPGGVGDGHVDQVGVMRMMRMMGAGMCLVSMRAQVRICVIVRWKDYYQLIWKDPGSLLLR